MRQITQRPWNERPEQADQTVAVLMALGFEIQVDFLDRHFDEHGTLVSETFTKRIGHVKDHLTEKVTVDYKFVRTYECVHCVVGGYPAIAVGLAADKYTHEAYHLRSGTFAPRYV